MLNDPLELLAVPFGKVALFSTGHSLLVPARAAVFRIGANEFVRPNRDGLGTFGVVMQGQAMQGV